MSRIGKLPIEVPNGTTVSVEGQTIKAKGSKGELSLVLSELITPKLENNELTVSPREDLVQAANDRIEAEKARGRRLPTFAEALDSKARTQWGTARARAANMVEGVSNGYSKTLELVGVGYRAQMQGTDLKLALGQPRSSSLVQTNSLLARLLPNSANSVRLSHTKARVSVIRANMSAARKARRSKPMKSSRDKMLRRAQRVRTKLRKVAEGRPRLSVARSHKNISAQIIDDEKGITLASASTLEKDVLGSAKTGGDAAAAALVGKTLAERAKEAGVEDVVFDRGGYMFHGRVKALADAAREGGLKF